MYTCGRSIGCVGNHFQQPTAHDFFVNDVIHPGYREGTKNEVNT